jgi:uncharacterized protein (DUF1697 family)
MKKLVIFLRGVNVNGISIKMDELKNVIESLSYKEVKTILASGNVIAAAVDDSSYEAHKEKIEKTLSTYFKYESYIILKTANQIHDIIKEASGHIVPEGYHHYILLSNDNIVSEQLKVLFETCMKDEKEQFILGEHGMYWIVPKGNTLKSDFGNKVLGKKEFKSVLTSRTINTILKMEKYL